MKQVAKILKKVLIWMIILIIAFEVFGPPGPAILILIYLWKFVQNTKDGDKSTTE